MRRRVWWGLALFFSLLNAVVALHAWRFTHFTANAGPRTRNPEKLPPNEKIKVMAILRAEAELGLRPTASIVECPYGSMLQTAKNRFVSMHLPPFLLANLLVFWGSVENGYWAFGLNAGEYARRLPTPTLV